MTTTTDPTTASPETVPENTITASGTIAVLPPALLWAASLAASTNPMKGVLCSIDIRRNGEFIRIAATDGHRLFRVNFPQSEKFFISPDQLPPFHVSPDAFSKCPTGKMVKVSLDSGGVATYLDSSDRAMEAKAWQLRSADTVGGTYPNIDQLWPEETALTCNPCQLIAMDATYLADFCKVASKFTSNRVVRLLTTNSPICPVIWRAELDSNFLQCTNAEPVYLEYLLMPVQIRA